MSQFTSDDAGSNFGVGYAGWDSAYRYCLGNNLSYFGAVFMLGGDAEEPLAFGNGMWTWTYLVRMYTRYDTEELGASECDENIATLASDFLDVMFSSTNRIAINSTGWAKLVAANYIGDTIQIGDIPFVSMEFILSVREQL